jgi:hypothetical protein
MSAEKFVYLECKIPPFRGHELARSETIEIYRRSSDEMLVLYDRALRHCWECGDVEELSDYLDDSSCQTVKAALVELS